LLYVHESHEVRGEREDEFEAAYREGWLPRLAAGEDARLLYFLHHAHGSGPSYRVVTLTAVQDGGAWQRLAERVREGDLSDWARQVDALRHEVTAKLLVPLPWSPRQALDLASVPGEAREHPLSLFMEDTVWPREGMLDAYIERSGSHYLAEMRANARERPTLLEIQAGYRTAFGSGRRREIVLWQKVVEPRGLRPLLTREVPEDFKRPGTWMHDALELRDRWESKLLRTVAWSPLW
jgi:hypothetical protein